MTIEEARGQVLEQLRTATTHMERQRLLGVHLGLKGGDAETEIRMSDLAMTPADQWARAFGAGWQEGNDRRQRILAGAE